MVPAACLGGARGRETVGNVSRTGTERSRLASEARRVVKNSTCFSHDDHHDDPSIPESSVTSRAITRRFKDRRWNVQPTSTTLPEDARIRKNPRNQFPNSQLGDLAVS